MHLDMSFDPSAPIPCTWQQHRNRSNNYISCPWDHQLIQLLEEILNVGDGPGIACSVLHVNVSSENAGHHNLLIGEVAQLLLWTGYIYSYSVYRIDATMAAGSENMAIDNNAAQKGACSACNVFGDHSTTKQTTSGPAISWQSKSVRVCANLLTGRGAGAEECTLPVNASCRLTVTSSEKSAVGEDA